MHEIDDILHSHPCRGDRMKRSVGLGLLLTLVCPPLALAAQAPADSLLKAVSAAAAANTVAINFVWTLVAGVPPVFLQGRVAVGGAGVPRAQKPPPTVCPDL